MSQYDQLEPKAVFQYFYEINQIPRGSGNEKAVSDYLVSFANQRGLEVHQDQAWNVIIRKKASPGYEQRPTVILQGHMDMVCEKAADSSHDFLKDPIEMVVEGDILRANQTTLGGDDGIAVAMALAILDDKELKHPPLEALFTTSEETGMGGAMAVQSGQLTGRYLLNIDSEEEGIFLVSCAGGCTLKTTFPMKREELSQKVKGLRIDLSGLQGGHSGMQIHLGRGNAVKILARLLTAVSDSCPDLRLGCIGGGSKHNAIPLQAHACFTCSNLEETKAEILKLAQTLKKEFATVDPNLEIQLTDKEIPHLYGELESQKLIQYLYLLPDGVQSMSADIPGLVQTSLNNAVLTGDSEKVSLTTSIRSALASQKWEKRRQLELLAQQFGGATQVESEYPAWEFERQSSLREQALAVYEEVSGQKPSYTAIHAGLECGLFKTIMPQTDMISFGPNLWDVHTAKEHLSISSVERVYNFTRRLLEQLQ